MTLFGQSSQLGASAAPDQSPVGRMLRGRRPIGTSDNLTYLWSCAVRNTWAFTGPHEEHSHLEPRA